jgi:hypothetical protein
MSPSVASASWRLLFDVESFSKEFSALPVDFLQFIRRIHEMAMNSDVDFPKNIADVAAQERLSGLRPSTRAKYFIFSPEGIIGWFISGIV